MPLGLGITISLPFGLGGILGGPTSSADPVASPTDGGPNNTDVVSSDNGVQTTTAGDGQITTSSAGSNNQPTTTPPSDPQSPTSTTPTSQPISTTAPSIPTSSSIIPSRTASRFASSSSSQLRNSTISSTTSTAPAQTSSIDALSFAVTETSSTTDAAGSVIIITTTRFSSPSQAAQSAASTSNGLSHGAIAGIVVGITLPILLLLLLILLLLRRRRRRHRDHVRASLTSWLDETPVQRMNRTDRIFEAVEGAWLSLLYATRLKKRESPPFESPGTMEKDYIPTSPTLSQRLSKRNSQRVTQPPIINILSEPPAIQDQEEPVAGTLSTAEYLQGPRLVSHSDLPDPRYALRALHDTHGLASFGSSATIDDAVDYTRQLQHKPASIQTFDTET